MLSRALLHLAYANARLRRYADGRFFQSIKLAIGIRERHAPPDDPLRQWALAQLANFSAEAGDPDGGVSYGQECVRLIRSQADPDSSLLGMAYMTIASSAARTLGGFEVARAAFDTSLAIRRAITGPAGRELVPILAEYGLFLSRFRELDAARAMLRQAVAIAELDTVPRSGYLHGSLSRLSTLENRAGNIGESLDLAQRAYEIAREEDGETSEAALRLRAIVAYRLIDFGDYETSIRILREIVPLTVASHGARNSQVLNYRLSIVEASLLAGDTTGVVAELAAVREGMQGQERFANSNASFVRQLAADYEVIAGRPEAARDTIDVAIQLEWTKDDPNSASRLAVLYARLYEVFEGPSDTDEVLRRNEEVQRLHDSTNVRVTPGWIDLRTSQARAEARAGLHEAALAHALEGERLAQQRLLYQAMSLPDARALQLAQQSGGPIEALIGIVDAESEEEVRSVWDRLVRWRGLVRTEMEERRPAALASADTAVADAHARWMTAQRRLGQLVVGGYAHPDDPETASEFSEAKSAAENAEREYVRLLGREGGPPPEAGLESVLAALGSDEALVGFTIGSIAKDEFVFGAFHATGRDRRPAWIRLGTVEEIEPLVREWVACLSTPPASAAAAADAEKTCRQLGERVRERLWSPLAKSFGGAKKIYLVGEGPAAGLPWLA
ncbi:MAG: tetratricopeptide repeat protein, partial [Thermoanaerobaculia bacterium]|nr:tetratricopeptide repeat protein [Thermoanaerobaculia bacterium]